MGCRSIMGNKLDNWSKRPEEGIKFDSGTAAYGKVIELAESKIQYKQP